MESKSQIIITWVLVTAMVLGFFYFCNPSGQKGDPNKAVPTLLSAAQPAASKEAPAEYVLGSTDPAKKYRMAVTLTNVGAAVQQVELAKYNENPREKKPLKLFQVPNEGPRSFATGAVRIAGGATIPLWQERWLLVDKGETPEGIAFAEYGAIIPDAAGKDAVRIRKRYELLPETYDLRVSHRLTNLSGQVLQLAVDQFGPVSLPNDSYQMDARNYQGAKYITAKKYINGNAITVPQSTAETDALDVLGSFQGTDPLLWTAASNRFFTAILRPLPRATAPQADLDAGGTVGLIDYVGEAKAGPLLPNDKHVALHLAGHTIQLGAADSATAATELPLVAFLGPKERDIFTGTTEKGPYSADYVRYDYGSVIHFSQGPCAFCTFPWLAKAILTLLDWIHLVTFNYGVAIIILVIVVRLLLHPLTRYSQVNMAVMQKKMAAIQPELERVKKRYANDKAQQQAELMKVYKEHNVNPAGGIMGCLPMLLQMPIWIALYAGLAVDIDLRHASFIPFWINDLSSPDTIMPVPPPPVENPLFTLPMMGGIYGLNLLPLLLAVVFFIQMKITTKNMPPAADPQQAQTQKISQWMIMIFPIFLYNAPSGLNLYIFASTLGGIFDTWLVRRHMREKGLLTTPAEKKE